MYAAANQARTGGEEGYAVSGVREMKVIVEGPYGASFVTFICFQ